MKLVSPSACSTSPAGPTAEAKANSATPQTGSFQTGRVMGLSFAHFIHDVYSSFLAPLLPLLIDKLSISLTQAGFLSTVMQLPALMNPIIGVWADKISTRWFIILAPSLTAIPMSLIGVAPSYAILLLLLFATGISVCIFHVPSPVMIARLSGPNKGRGMSFYMTGGELARTLGPMAAVGAVALLGLEGFYPVMVFGWLTSLWLYFNFKDVPRPVSTAKPKSALNTWREMSFVLWPLTVILVSRGFMHASLAMFLPTFIRAETGNLWLAGIGLSIFEAAGVLGILAAGSLSDRFGRRRMLLIALLGAPVSLFLFTAVAGWLSYAMLVLCGITILSTTPVMLALVQENAGSSPSAANGFFMMVSFIARSAIVVVVGFMGDMIGLKLTFVISAALGLVGIPFIFKLPRR